MSKGKSIAKNYIYSLLYEILVLIVPIITTPYISRVLGADSIGIYSYTLSIATYFVLFGKLGFQTYGQLKIAENRDNKQLLSVNFFEIVIARLITMVLASLAYISVFFIDKEYSFYYLLLLTFFVSSLIDFTWLLQGIEEFKKITIRNSIVKIISLILIFIFIKEKNDLPLYFLIIQGSTLIGNLSIIPFVKKHICKINFKEIHVFKHIIKSLPYFIPTIATTIYLSLDKSMIGWITHSNFENGYYEQAHKIEQVAVTIVTSLSIVTMPRMAYFFKNKEYPKAKHILDETLQFILLISIPMTCGLIGISKILIPWFLGDGYESCINLLCIFSILIIVVGLNNAVGKQVLIPIRRQKQYNISVIVGSIVNVILNLLLIFKLSSVGAAVASVVAETTILLLFIYFARDFVSLTDIFKKGFKYLLSGMIMMCALIIINNYYKIIPSFKYILIEIIGGFLAYIFLLVIMRDKYLINQIDFIFNKLSKKSNY